MLKDYFSLAFINIKHRGIRSWLTMLGIFIGIAAVVSLISLGQGLQHAITGQFSDLAPDRLIVQNAETGFGPPGSTAVKKLNENDVEIIESVNDVILVVPRLIRVVKVEYNDIGQFTYIGSLPPDQKKIDFIYESFNVESEQGKLLNSNGRGKVVLGNDFIAYDKFGKKIRAGSKITIQNKEFEVAGILKKTSTFTLNSVVLMGEDDMKEILNISDEFDAIAVQVSDKDKSLIAAEAIKEKMRKDRNLEEGKEDFSVQTPEQAVQSIKDILNIVNLVVIGIAAISLLVGGIGIANTMYTSVLERTKEIGVMKAIGAENKNILYVFIIEAGFLGLTGGIVGAIIGLFLAYGVSLIANSFLPGIGLRVSPSIPLLLAAISFSFCVGIASGIIPAIQASKLKPVQALRA